MFNKERRKLEDQVKQEGRLPPGQSLTLKFPVLHYGPVPKADLDNWTFRAYGLVDQEKSWSWQEFLQLPKKTAHLRHSLRDPLEQVRYRLGRRALQRHC